MQKRYILALIIVLFGASMWGLVNTLNTETKPSAAVEGTAADHQPVQKDDLIKVTAPYNGQVITSPLTIKGQARGSWFFEGSFPVYLTTSDGTVIAQGPATAGSDWMTSDYVPFTAQLEFKTPTPMDGTNSGYVILEKDNPSGDKQFDNSVAIQVQW